MISYNVQKVKFFATKLKMYAENENYKIEECPNCQSKELIRWGKYKRNIVYYEKGQKQEKTIEIRRIRCKGCGKTHAIIPCFIVPYKVHSSKYITEVLVAKIGNKKSNKEIEEKYKISRQLLRKWKECIESHAGRIRAMTEEKLEKSIKRIKKELYEFREEYYKKNKEIYMMYRGFKEGPILKWAPT